MTTLKTETETPRRRAVVDTWRFPVLLFAAMAAVLTLVVQLSHDNLDPDEPDVATDISDTPYFGGWMQFDSGWYVSIAEHGYDDAQIEAFESGQQSAVAFFPLYPLTVRQVAIVTGDDFTRAAEITTVVFGLLTLLLFWFWAGRHLTARARRFAVLFVALYPYAWYLYGSGYGDVLFIAATITAFSLTERDRPVLAGLAAAAASATRFIGVGTVIGITALMLERRGAIVREPSEEPRRPWSGWRFDRSRLRRGDAGVLLGASGFVGYCTFLWIRTGDALAFNTVQAAPGWNQGAGPKTWFKYSFFAEVFRDSFSYSVRLIAQGLLATLFLVAVVVVARRIGKAYALYVAVIIVIPLIGSSTFQGFGRYLLGAFPVFAVGGMLLDEHTRGHERNWFVIGLFACSAALLVVQASFFGRGYYLS